MTKDQSALGWHITHKPKIPEKHSMMLRLVELQSTVTQVLSSAYRAMCCSANKNIPARSMPFCGPGQVHQQASSKQMHWKEGPVLALVRGRRFGDC